MHLDPAKFFELNGRASRGEVLTLGIVAFLGWIVLGIFIGMANVSAATGTQVPMSWLGWVWQIGLRLLLTPCVAVVIRRLHDTDRSGLWVLLAVPLWAAHELTSLSLGYFTRDVLPPLVVEHLPELSFVGYVGAALLMIFMLLPGTDGPNRFDSRADEALPQRRPRLSDRDAAPHTPVFDFGPSEAHPPTQAKDGPGAPSDGRASGFGRRGKTSLD